MNKDEIVIKDLMVNIPLGLYNQLLETKFNYKKAVQELEVFLENAELSWNKEELDFDKTDTRNLMKRLALYQYNKKIEQLKSEGEDNNE